MLIVDCLHQDKYEIVSGIIEVDRHPIEAFIRANTPLILRSLEDSEEGQILSVSVNVAAGELAKEVEPLKIVYLNEKGGLFHGVTGEKLDTINLDEVCFRIPISRAQINYDSVYRNTTT